MLQFATAHDRAKVMAGHSWTFNQHLIAMDEIERGLQPLEIALD